MSSSESSLVSSPVSSFDVVFIGSGPGGYVGAIRAAQLGLSVAVVEKNPTFGGTCLNVGCIPSKALLESSELFHFTQHDAKQHGIEIEKSRVNIAQMMQRKSSIVNNFTKGIEGLFKKNKITAFYGFGKILPDHKVAVLDHAGSPQQVLSAKKIVIATGSCPIELPFLKFNEKNVVSSTGALALEKIPESLLVIGGGVIGLELGSVWARLGTKVTILEYNSEICPFMDQETIKILRRSLEKMGVRFITQAKVFDGKTSSTHDFVEVFYEDMKSGEKKSLKAEVVLVSIGRRPYSEGLGLSEVGIQVDSRGFIQVNDHLETSVPGIYAIGDVAPGPMLAHKAEEEGVAVAERIAGKPGHVNYNTVPSVIYTLPEVASVGLTEEQAKAQGLQYRVGKFPFKANGRAQALGITDGMVKIIADKETDRILGGHIVGPRASELLGEIVVAMEFHGSSEDLARSFHAHPTLNEVIREAALAVDQRARQI